MKLLIINSLYYPNILGGAERSVQHLAEALTSAGHEVVVVCLGTEPSIKEVNGVRVYYVPLFNVYWPFDKRYASPARLLWNLVDIYNPVMARRVTKIIDAEKPDVVHTNNLLGFSPSVWHVLRKKGIRLVHTVRDHYLLCPRSTMFKRGKNCARQCFLCRLFSYPKRSFSVCVDQVIGISKFVLERHQSYKWFQGVPQSVIYNSYDACTDSKCRPASEKIRFGYIGRVDPRKGLEELLCAFMSLGNQSRAELVIAGSGDEGYLEKLKTRVKDRSVRFLGFVSPEIFYNEVGIVIVPSLLNEALGRAILEAYAHGVPVIAAKRGGIPEIVENGRTGLLFDPNRKGDLENCMKEVLGSPSILQHLSVACLSKSKEFMGEVIAAKYLQAYEGTAPFGDTLCK